MGGIIGGEPQMKNVKCYKKRTIDILKLKALNILYNLRAEQLFFAALSEPKLI